jgi:putative oligomerization/nucleic acid binding protein
MSPGPKTSDLAEELTKLAKFHADGVLTDEEFQTLKARLIAETTNSQTGNSPFVSLNLDQPAERGLPRWMKLILVLVCSILVFWFAAGFFVGILDFVRCSLLGSRAFCD